MTEQMAEADSRVGLRAFALNLDRLVWLALSVYVALAAFVLWRSAILRPFSDVLDWIQRDEQFQAHGGVAQYLFAPHNLHRLVWTFALLDLDQRVFGGSGWPLIVSGVVGLAVAAWVLARAAYKAAPQELAATFAATAAMLALMPANVLDAALPIFTEYLHTLGFGLVALALAEGSEASPMGWRGVGALACVAASALGTAVGLAFLPALAFGAWLRRDWRWLCVVLTAGAAFAALYFGGPHPGSGAGLAAAARQPWRAATLTLSALGLPWSRVTSSLGLAEGSAILALAIAGLCDRGRDASSRLARTLIVFSLATAVMAGLGRADLESHAPVRYAIFMTPAHVGLLILAAPRLERLWRARPHTVKAAVPWLLAVLLLQDVLMSIMAVRGSDNIRNLITAFEAGRRTPEMTMIIHPDLGHAATVFERLRAEHLFQHELHLPVASAQRSAIR